MKTTNLNSPKYIPIQTYQTFSKTNKNESPTNKNESPDTKISDSIKLQIVKELVEPMYVNDVKSTIQGKKCWRSTGQIFETMSKVLVAVGGIISFSSGYYSYPTLGFVAGSVSTISLALLQFSSFSYSENKKQSSELNILLNKLDIDSIPELERQVDTASFKTSSVQNDNSESETEIDELKKEIENLSYEKNQKNKEIDELKNELIKLQEIIKSQSYSTS